MHLKIIGFLAGLAVATTVPALAGDFSYADRHGNLVIESDAGYKRILVGQGGQAHELGQYLGRVKGYADGLGATRIFPDSQGNLTIRAASGYKEVLVGRADEVGSETRRVRGSRAGGYDPEADFYSEHAAHTTPVVCAGSDAIIKGRSYMYGLDRNETPVILTCEE